MWIQIPPPLQTLRRSETENHSRLITSEIVGSTPTYATKTGQKLLTALKKGRTKTPNSLKHRDVDKLLSRLPVEEGGAGARPAIPTRKNRYSKLNFF